MYRGPALSGAPDNVKGHPGRNGLSVPNHRVQRPAEVAACFYDLPGWAIRPFKILRMTPIQGRLRDL